MCHVHSFICLKKDPLDLLLSWWYHIHFYVQQSQYVLHLCCSLSSSCHYPSIFPCVTIHLFSLHVQKTSIELLILLASSCSSLYTSKPLQHFPITSHFLTFHFLIEPLIVQVKRLPKVATCNVNLLTTLTLLFWKTFPMFFKPVFARSILAFISQSHLTSNVVKVPR